MVFVKAVEEVSVLSHRTAERDVVYASDVVGLSGGIGTQGPFHFMPSAAW